MRWWLAVLLLIASTLTAEAQNRQLAVRAGGDRKIAPGAAAQLEATVEGAPPQGLRAFWFKLSGPGEARFASAQFSDSFETGDVSQWLEGGGGNHTGSSYVSEEKPRSGKYSWKAHNLPGRGIDAKLLRWRFDYREAYFSAWYFWPEDYLVNGNDGQYVNIFQWKERADPWDPTYIVAVKEAIGDRSRDAIVVHDYHGRRIVRSPQNVELPKGRWFNLTAYMKAGRSDGELIVWLDGRRVYALKGINMLGSDSNPAFLMWGVGNYGGAGAGKFIYVDDVSVTRADQNLLKTPVTFSAPGVYVLGVTVDDGESTASDEMTVTVVGDN